MSEPESIADVRKRSWKTRREKYGERGHSGSYCHPQPICTARWNERLRSMEAALKHALAVMDSLDVYNVYKVTRNEVRAALAGAGKDEQRKP